MFVAVSRISAVLTESNDPWFLGPFGWVLGDVAPLEEPYIRAKGNQRLWQPGAETVRRLRERYPSILAANAPRGDPGLRDLDEGRGPARTQPR